MNLHHLAVFRAVAEAGSFTRGGESLGVSQSAASQIVAELESSLGTQLFDRVPRAISLTPAGETLLRYARRIADLGIEAERVVAELSGARKARLAIGASETLGSYLLPAILKQFRERYPDTELEYAILNADALRSRLVDRTLEVGLTDEALSTGPKLESTTVGRDVLVILAPAGHPLVKMPRGTKKAAQADADALSGQPFILAEPGTTARIEADRALASIGVRVTPAMTVNNPEAVKGAVAAGLGLAILPRMCAGRELQDDELVEVPVRGWKASRLLHALTLRSGRQSKAVGAFLSLLRKTLAR